MHRLKPLAPLFDNFLTLIPDSNQKDVQPPYVQGMKKPTVTKIVSDQ